MYLHIFDAPTCIFRELNGGDADIATLPLTEALVAKTWPVRDRKAVQLDSRLNLECIQGHCEASE